MNESLGQDHKHPTWTAAVRFIMGGHLIPLSKTLRLFTNENLFNKSVRCEGKKWLFPSPHLEIPPPENTGRCEVVEVAEKNWVTCSIWSSQRDSENAGFNCSTSWANSKTQNCCSYHSQLWYTFILPMRPLTRSLMINVPCVQCKQLPWVEILKMRQ